MRRSPCPECFPLPDILTNRVLPCKAPLSIVPERVQVGCDLLVWGECGVSAPRRRRLEATAQTFVGLGGRITTCQKRGVCLCLQFQSPPIRNHVRPCLP